MLWTNVLLPKTTARYYALKADEYFAEKVWTRRIEIERTEKERIDKFYNNLPEFNPQGQLIWAGWLTYEWLLYDQLPWVAIVLFSATTTTLSTLAVVLTTFADNWNAVYAHLTHYLYAPGRYADINTYLMSVDNLTGLNWTAYNKEFSLFLWPFEITSNSTGKTQYTPVNGFLQLQGSSSALLTALIIFQSHYILLMAYWMFRTLISVWFLDALFSLILKMTRKLAPLHKKLRVQ